MTTTRPAVTFGTLSATEIELADLASEGASSLGSRSSSPVQAAWGACEVIFGVYRSIVVWFADRGYPVTIVPACDREEAGRCTFSISTRRAARART
jgi:hypothetical protein